MKITASNKNEYEYTKMPWGKYKGRYLREVPDDYIIWAVKNWRDQATAHMFVVELARRNIDI
jgi:uncharacterized protein (DUF3820 family)